MDVTRAMSSAYGHGDQYRLLASEDNTALVFDASHYALRPTTNPADPTKTPTIITVALSLFKLIHFSTSDRDVAPSSVRLLCRS